MNIQYFDINGPFLLTPQQHSDHRGVFVEAFRTDHLSEIKGSPVEFVQQNISKSKFKNTIRGLHFQAPPSAQGKLVRCSRGKILDIVVDLRRNSSSYSKHIAITLDAKKAQSFWVPIGFAHGFLTLEDDCELTYLVTANYDPNTEASLYWADPDLEINWGIEPDSVVLSEKDEQAPVFSSFQSPF